ncbi:MAG: hypothetical protein OEZ58_20550 [Gammaproteobacteria bacterium]|nr:hypothetical protein [Gammaproteobacteria bacterium]MDH5731383.1 hypothetical protein [Gammaproteobacteria bacterium]
MRLHRFTPIEFSELREQWQDLLNRSDADQLFLSWSWMHSWWNVYGDLANDELLLIGIYDNDRLVCIAPFYSSKKTIKGLLSVKIIQFLGTRVDGSSGFRSEYLQCIVDRETSEKCLENVFDYLLADIGCDELWLNDLVVGSKTHELAKKFSAHPKAYKRLQAEDTTYGVNVKVSFQDYVASLGKNTRLKAYNRRKVLESLGEVIIESANAQNYRDVLQYLSDFHLDRWETSISYAKHGEFIALLINDTDVTVSGVVVKLNHEVVGCTLDLIAAGKSYNLQSGYKAFVDKKIAMGSLAIGYAIEFYCDNPEISYYDFLAGEGKKSNYKERIAQPLMNFESTQYIFSFGLRLMYRFKDKFKS